MTLDDAVTFALAHHPRLRVSSAEESAASAAVDEARTDDLPSAGVSGELNRSTGNTVPGALVPVDGFTPIAGAPRGRTFDGGSWQTGMSVWARWDVVSLLRQAVAVDVALASRREASAAASAQRLEVAYASADAFLAEVAAEQAVISAQASLDRARVFATSAHALAAQQLRPELDAVRAEAEVAFAQTQLARTEQALEVRRAQLAAALGVAGVRVFVVADGVLTPDVAESTRTPETSTAHPLLLAADAVIAHAAEQRRSVKLAYLPRVDLVAALSARGSGLYGSPAAGLVPDVPNWVAGVVVSWPLTEFSKDAARERVAQAAEVTANARREETLLAVQAQLETAHALLDGARRVARGTPAALESARAAQTQARARYDAGLASILDVADANRSLAQAELDDVLARLDVQRADLLLARARGDLTPFLQTVRAGHTEER